MNKIKHSKYKNPHLIYEFLVRQVTSDILSKIPLKESKAYNIIQRNFSKGSLKEELDIYYAVLSYNAKSRESADELIKEAINLHGKINNDSLKKRKYQVIKEIRETYDLEKLFTAKISNYKESASVYLFLESVKNSDLVTRVTTKELLIENLLTDKKEGQPFLLNESLKGYTKEDIKIAYKLILNRYNKLFSDSLNESQKEFIQDYVCSSPENNAWVVSHISKARTMLKEQVKTIGGKDVIMKMKLNECLNTLDKIESKNVFKEPEYYAILNFYQLVNDVKQLC